LCEEALKKKNQHNTEEMYRLSLKGVVPLAESASIVCLFTKSILIICNNKFLLILR